MAIEFWCDSTGPIVQTKAGKIRGYRLDGTYMFRGVKYADAERFMMPKPVQPWEGVKDCLTYGFTAPTIRKPVIHKRDVTHGFRYWPENEDCQYLNIWTKDINNDVRRPVMVWIHGGGYTNGSSIEHKGYEADGLCTEGDVVVVSLNHRLNILGHLNLGAFGGDYANSGNASIADLVAALQWIHENIANFGGDPENVTIFGQSGGGGKVMTLMQYPEAAGLFHKCVIQSGCQMVLRGCPSYEDSAKVGVETAKELGLSAENIDEIKKVPFDDLVEAWRRAARRLAAEGVDVDWSPCPNGFFVGAPQDVGLTEYAKKVPLLTGTMVAEFPTVAFPDKMKITEEEIHQMSSDRWGADVADQIIADFKKSYPDKPLVNLLYLDSIERTGCQKLLKIRCEQCDSPNYNYMLTYDFKYNGGLPAWHSADLMLIFRSCMEVPIYHEEGAMRLSDQMSTSWSTFAHCGNPNNEKVPVWTEYNLNDKPTMVFDAVTTEKKDFDRDLIATTFERIPTRPSMPPYEAR